MKTLLLLLLSLTTLSAHAQCIGTGPKITMWFRPGYLGEDVWVPGDVGEAFTGAGQCAGEGTNTGGFGGVWWITITGDDEDTPQIDGFTDGEEITIHRVRGEQRTRMFVLVGEAFDFPVFHEDTDLEVSFSLEDIELALPDPDPYVELRTRLEVWPTVTDGYVSGFAPAGWLLIYDTLGRLMHRMHVDGPFTLNLSHRTAGPYFLLHERGEAKMVFVR